MTPYGQQQPPSHLALPQAAAPQSAIVARSQSQSGSRSQSTELSVAKPRTVAPAAGHVADPRGLPVAVPVAAAVGGYVGGGLQQARQVPPQPQMGWGGGRVVAAVPQPQYANGLAVYRGGNEDDDSSSEEEETESETESESSEDADSRQRQIAIQQQQQQQQQALNRKAMVASSYPKETRQLPPQVAGYPPNAAVVPREHQNGRPPSTASSSLSRRTPPSLVPTRETPRRNMPSSTPQARGFGSDNGRGGGSVRRRGDDLDPFGGGLLSGGLFGAIGRQMDRMLSEAFDGFDDRRRSMGE